MQMHSSVQMQCQLSVNYHRNNKLGRLELHYRIYVYFYHFQITRLVLQTCSKGKVLAKFSSSCLYILSLTYFFVVFIFCKVRLILWFIKRRQSFIANQTDLSTSGSGIIQKEALNMTLAINTKTSFTIFWYHCLNMTIYSDTLHWWDIHQFLTLYWSGPYYRIRLFT